MNNIPEKLDFTEQEDLIVSIPVTIPGESQEFRLKTFTGADATKYHNAQARSVRLDNQGNPVGFTGDVANIEPLLVSLCLYDEKGKKVSVSKIGNWPFPVQRRLYKVAQEINKINEEVRLSALMAEAFDSEENPPPCSIEEIREWSSNFEGKKWSQIRMTFSPTDEELEAKNSQEDTMDGLD